MKLEPKKLVLKNGQEFELRSPEEHEAVLMLLHLTTTHNESNRNLNQPAEYWKNFSTEDEEKVLRDCLISHTKFLLCAFHEGKIVGGLSLVGADSLFQKFNARLGMSVQKAFSGMGVGTALVDRALELGKYYGFHRVELTVRTYNLAGIALYERAGFEKVGTLRGAAFIDGKFVDELLYQKVIG